MPVENIITENLDIWTSAIKTKSPSGRGSSKKLELYGINKLRELILDLAFKGKLVPQDCNDEPADILLASIDEEKQRLILDKKIRKPKALPDLQAINKPFEMPEGWSWTFLGRVCKKLTDGSHNPPSDSGSGYPMLSSQNVNFGRIDFANPSRFVNEENFQKEHLRTQAKPNDVLLNIVASIGRSAVVPENAPKFVLQRSVAVLDSQLDSHFLSWQLVSPLCLDYYDKNAKGTAQKGIYLGKLGEMLIVVPPIKEQVRITQKIDELMGLCDQLESQTEASIKAHQTLLKSLLETLTNAKDADELNESWQRISEHFDVLFTTEDSIDQLKQTILQLAVMGKLVKQDLNDEPASRLLERIDAEKEQLIKDKKIKKQKPLPPISDEEKPFDLPDGWKWVKFDHIAKNEKNALKAGPFGSALKKSFYVEDGYKIYGQEQVISGDENIGDYYINQEKFESLISCKVQPGDMLISLVGTIGKVLILSQEAKQGIINPRLVKLSLHDDVSREYIRIVLGSRLIQEELFDKSHGSTMNVLNLGLLRQLVFPLPKVIEQKRIVTRVHELLALCDNLKCKFQAQQKVKVNISHAFVKQVK
ncbi:type I restriction enzyme S subunit [Alteromonas sp. 76-1]|jgi:type I restriction enzyme S subunit|uniref:restriction endonuclease subunit S n=1 Tax=Alteromonas sp. 76-1 TaxID=2358187 RepID=UPI000FD164D7|nr:restriction endonuclease subunit S [Alteromonas sp. 76-1]VEL97559.1 type I restriction enzyme S subunit [Alteromonas sp. 76-1]